MAGPQIMTTQAARIGKWKGEILSRAIPAEVLQLAGAQKSIPKNVSDTVVYRRWVPYNATVANPNILVQDISPIATAETEAANRVNTMVTGNLLAEGTTPTPETIVAQDITVVLQQYGCLYNFSDKVADLYEDDIADALKTQVAERIALIRELELYSKLRASTNRFYGGAGTSIATVAGKLTAKMLRKIARSLAANHTKKITQILAPTPNIGTKPIEAAYLVFCHSDVEADLRDAAAFPGYTPVAAYGSRKPLHELEIGSFEQFRFIASPELVPFQNGGADVGSTGCVSTGATKIDVYPVLVVGQEAYGTVALRGAGAFDLSVIPVGNKDSADPLGQRGYVGSKFYASSVILNQQWMATAFVGAGDLA
jgi:N4-gp56 family major capsid protein